MPARTARRKRRIRVLAAFQIAFVVILASALIGSLAMNLFSRGNQGAGEDALGTLGLAGRVGGNEAEAWIETMHGLDVELEDAFVVEYVRGSERGAVWVGITESSGAAAALSDSLLAAVERDGSGFTGVERLTIAGQEMYSATGSADAHFFYRSSRMPRSVVWLQTNAADVLAFVRDAVSEY